MITKKNWQRNKNMVSIIFVSFKIIHDKSFQSLVPEWKHQGKPKTKRSTALTMQISEHTHTHMHSDTQHGLSEVELL